MLKEKMMKKMSMILVLALVFSTTSQLFEVHKAFAESTMYSQDFGTVPSAKPSGWTVPAKGNYLSFNTYTGTPAGAPESVSGIAMNAVASGNGDRPAYVDLDTDMMIPSWVQDYAVFDFDFYMAGGVNTCNIFTMGNSQNNSCTDLSNTFFALGNGDGVGARNTLRYYNYENDSWVTIANMNEQWLKVTVYADFVDQKMAFDLKDSEGNNIGTYGPFSFSSKFTSATPLLNRIVMSAFRTNGGSITLNTWIDNFTISSMDADYITFLNYEGTLPVGTMGVDYSLVDMNGEFVLNMMNRSLVEDTTADSVSVRVINADVMVTQLPETGYQSIFSFDDDANGNLLVDKKGALLNQINSTQYNIVLGNYQRIKTNEWYNVKAYVFLTASTDSAHITFVISGDFGDGQETVECALETRNSDKFDKLNVQIGGIVPGASSKGNVLFKNLSLTAKERPDITFLYDDTKGTVKIDDTEIKNGQVQESTIPNVIRFTPGSGYDINKVMLNDKDITSDLSMDFFSEGYRYTLALKDEDVIFDIQYEKPTENPMIATKESEPYALDPSQEWDMRKYASEARTLQIKNAKMAYRLYKPAGYHPESDEKYPLVVSLRAEGEGNTGFDNVPYTAGHIEDILTSGQNAEDFPCFILSPQCYDENWTDNNWTNLAMVLMIIDNLSDEFSSIDTDRIYIGGLSGGANATWLTTAIVPDLFAGAFIMSGTALDTEYAEYYQNTPIWTFYALDDNAQRVPRTNIAMINEIKNKGGTIVSTAYNTGGHTVTWKEGLKSPLFQWLFAQKKNADGENGAIESGTIDRMILDYNNSINASLHITQSLPSEINNTDCQIQETALGNMVTDAMRRYTGADIAVIRSNHLGESIHAGETTESDILNALPVKLNVSVVEVKGSDILRLLTNSLTYYPVSDGRFLQVSGLTITFDPGLRPSQRILSVLVNQEQIDIDKTYKVAVTDNLISNKLNNTYDGDLTVVQSCYQTISQMLVNYINEKEQNEILPEMGRITLVID